MIYHFSFPTVYFSSYRNSFCIHSLAFHRLYGTEDKLRQKCLPKLIYLYTLANHLFIVIESVAQFVIYRYGYIEHILPLIDSFDIILNYEVIQVIKVGWFFDYFAFYRILSSNFYLKSIHILPMLGFGAIFCIPSELIMPK